MVDVFKEVDEELKNEEFSKWIKKYGIAIIVFSVLLVIATAVNSFYRIHRERTNAQQTEILDNISKMHNPEEMITESAKLDEKHKLLSNFLIASKYLVKKDLPKANTLYEEIINSNSLSSEYTDLARIYEVQNILNMDEPNLKKAAELLSPILDKSNSYYYIAAEQNALIQDLLGNKKEAREILHSISMDDEAPRSISTETEKLETLYK